MFVSHLLGESEPGEEDSATKLQSPHLQKGDGENTPT